MKTKFLNTPPGSEGKQARHKLRYAARVQLFALFDIVSNTPDYSKLKLISLYYVLPTEDTRGFLSCSFNENESIRFYLSPGEAVGLYITDKIEYIYRDQDQAVSLEITREEWVNDFFEWLQDKGKVVNTLLAAQRAN